MSHYLQSANRTRDLDGCKMSAGQEIRVLIATVTRQHNGQRKKRQEKHQKIRGKNATFNEQMKDECSFTGWLATPDGSKSLLLVVAR